MKYGIVYSFLNMTHMLKQCINFTNKILNVNYQKSLVSRYNPIGNKNSTCLYCNNNKKKYERQVSFDILRVTSLQ